MNWNYFVCEVKLNSYVNEYYAFWKLKSDQALKNSLLNSHVYLKVLDTF